MLCLDTYPHMLCPDTYRAHSITLTREARSGDTPQQALYAPSTHLTSPFTPPSRPSSLKSRPFPHFFEITSAPARAAAAAPPSPPPPPPAPRPARGGTAPPGPTPVARQVSHGRRIPRNRPPHMHLAVPPARARRGSAPVDQFDQFDQFDQGSNPAPTVWPEFPGGTQQPLGPKRRPRSRGPAGCAGLPGPATGHSRDGLARPRDRRRQRKHLPCQ